MNRKKDGLYYILLGILLLALVASGYLAKQRVVLEQGNKNVEVTLESQELERLARFSPYSEADLMGMFKEAGATSILFKELVLSDLEPHQVWLLSGNQLLLDEKYQTEAQELLEGYNYLLTRQELLYDQLRIHLSAKVKEIHLPDPVGGEYLVGVPLNRAELSSVGLGFDQRLMKLAVEKGYTLQVQLRNWPQTKPEGIRTVFETLLPYKGEITAVLFNDFIIPGFPEYLHVVGEGIDSVGANFAFIESFIFNQQGAVPLGLADPTRVVRMHSVGANEMVNMSPQRALDRLVLSVTDRQVRVLLVRFFFPMDTANWLDVNLRFFQGGDGFTGLLPALEREGYQAGVAQPYALHVTSEETAKILTFIIGMGIISGGMLLLRRFGWPRLALLAGAAGVLGWLGVNVMTGLLPLAVKVMALGAVIIFPTWAVLLAFEKDASRGAGAAVLALLKMSLVSLMGALLMVGLFAQLSFILKLDQFVGVKVAHLVPVLLLLFAFYFLREGKDWIGSISALLSRVVTNGYLLLLGLFLVIGLLYITRTGNEAVAVASWELTLRSLLDQWLGVRPRTKEFLIGHPLMLLTLYVGYRHRYLPLLLLGIIGQISMVNTFAHVHTPLWVSLVRTGNGLWLGVLIGLGLILLWKLYGRLESRYFHG